MKGHLPRLFTLPLSQVSPPYSAGSSSQGGVPAGPLGGGSGTSWVDGSLTQPPTQLASFLFILVAVAVV